MVNRRPLRIMTQYEKKENMTPVFQRSLKMIKNFKKSTEQSCNQIEIGIDCEMEYLTLTTTNGKDK